MSAAARRSSTSCRVTWAPVGDLAGCIDSSSQATVQVSSSHKRTRGDIREHYHSINGTFTLREFSRTICNILTEHDISALAFSVDAVDGNEGGEVVVGDAHGPPEPMNRKLVLGDQPTNRARRQAQELRHFADGEEPQRARRRFAGRHASARRRGTT